jgi:putative ABC transport system ATP-binding protein
MAGQQSKGGAVGGERVSTPDICVACVPHWAVSSLLVNVAAVFTGFMTTPPPSSTDSRVRDVPGPSTSPRATVDPSPNAAVELRGVSHVYGTGNNQVVALDDVHVTFPRGSWTAVMGPSGSGKSTLLHAAGGLERPAGGQVLIDGQDITHASEAALTRLRQTTVGFVFQNFNLIGSLSAEQNVAMPLRLAGLRPSRTQVRDVLERVGLADRARHRPRELSGGQQQRVAIARAMVTRPTVLLADEPTGALDSRAARTILTMLRTMAEEGQTIVMVTHDPLAAASADEVLFLTDGHVVDRVARPSVREVADRLARMEDPLANASSVSP